MSALDILARGKQMLSLLGVKSSGTKIGELDVLQLLDILGPKIEEFHRLSSSDSEVQTMVLSGLDEQQAKVFALLLKQMYSRSEKELELLWTAINDPRIILALFYSSKPVDGLRGLIAHAVRQRAGSLPTLQRRNELVREFISGADKPVPLPLSRELLALEQQDNGGQVSRIVPVSAEVHNPLPSDREQSTPRDSSSRATRRRRRNRKRSRQVQDA